ncbi:MAG: DeoR/GlpR family DNA-binding transcription regulator [Balneolales bacterium]
MAKYNVAERRNQTLKALRAKGQISVVELSRLLEVSEVTIRKDLEYLEKHNLLVRTHGGAMQNGYLVYDQPIEEKGKLHAEEKRYIGEAAANLIEDSDSVFMEAGSTMVQVARQIKKRNLTILTNGINVALELLRLADVELIMLGGMVRPTSACVVGPYAEQMVQEHSCRKFFLGVDGFDLERGLSTTNTLEAHLCRTMVKAAQETIVVTDSSKFGRRGLSRICSIEEIDVVVTDHGIQASILRYLEDRDIRVIIAGKTD